MEAEKGDLEAILSDSTLYGSEEGARRAAETSKRYEALLAELDQAMERWMELEERESVTP
jgi:hypothetical protein